MCGIMGHLQIKNGLSSLSSLDVLIEGLRRSEYRGYDSTGLALLTENHEFSYYKAVGPIHNLEKVLPKNLPPLIGGIGHTRWATHGGVTVLNAHPHGNEQLAIVHNGIVENYLDLKKELLSEGYEFKSQTDSEVFWALLDSTIKKQKEYNLAKALIQAFQKAKGHSAIVAMDKIGKQIVAIKRGAPIVFGVNDKTHDSFVSSDPYALVGYASTLYFPEDEVIGVISTDVEFNFQCFEVDKEERLIPCKKYETRAQNLTAQVEEKNGFDHFMLKEIHEQPGLIRSLCQKLPIFEEQATRMLEEDGIPHHLHIVACGTALHAGILIKYLMEMEEIFPASYEFASEFRYRNPIVQDSDVGLFISQSGETADTLASQELCKEIGIKTHSIVNVIGSTLYRKCDWNWPIYANTEIGVASTKAFTMQVVVGYLLTQVWGKGKLKETIVSELSLLALRIEELLEKNNQIMQIASKIYQKKGFLFTGRGIYYPIALEGALKLKEIAYVHAEGYAAGELKHGPLALIDENMVNVAILGPQLLDKTLGNVEEVKARGGIIVAFGPHDYPRKQDFHFYVDLNFTNLHEWGPLYANVGLQLLSYNIAKLKGTDIDRPRNLAKSVTVE